MSIFDARYDRLSEIKKKRAANSPVQSGEVKAAGTVKASPFDGYAVTSRPGKRNAPTAGASTNHAGLDRAMPRGTALKLPIDVTYYRSGSDKARGKWIEFKDAGGNILHYQHLDSYGIFKPGETVPAGSQIAVSGASGISTGAHLHEEYWSPDGQNITESYWGGLSKGTASGALPTEYKKAGGNVFNVGTNALAREGKSALAGSYEGLSRFEKVQMLKKRRDERRGLRERVADKMSRADEAYTFGRKKDDYSVGGIINKWQENENAKALAYEKKNADTVNRAQQRLGDDNFKKAAFDGLERAKRTVGRVYIKPSGRDDTTVLTSYMTDEELLTYSGLLQTEGQKSAAEYIDAIKDTLKARAFEHAQYPTKFAGTAKQLYNNPYDLPLGGQGAAFKKQLPLQKSGVTLEDLENESGKSYAKALAMGTAASFATAAALGKTGEQMIKNAVTGKYEPTDIYAPAFMPARLQRSAQEGTTRNDSQWMKFLKSAGFSIAGSLVNAAAGGPIGAGASLAMMGASAAGQSAFEGAERGLTPAQATTLGAVNGALEAATEMIPVKNIFAAFKSKRAGVELAKSILHSGFENAEQEAINTLAGNIADEMIAGDKSELMENAREYAENLQKERGLSNEKAISEGIKKAAFNAYIYDPLYSALSGAFSGAVQTGAAAAAGRAAADISDTVRAYSAGQNAGAAIDKLGYKVELTDNAELDGKVDKKKGIVYFNPEGTDFKQTVKHEISHMLENNEKYGEFRSFVKEEMPQAYKAAERRVSDRLERVNAYREERGLSKYKSDAETIEAETFAELAEVLKSDRLIRRFALGSDMPKTMRVIEFARDASARLSEKLGTDGGWSTAARKWAAALSEAQADESGVRNKIAENEKGKYVQAERQVIKSDNPQDWESEIINYVNNIVRGGKDLEITLDNGEKLKITGRTAWKLGYRNGKNENNPISDKIYMVKGNASGVIDEVASVSKFSNSKAAKKVHSGDFGKSGFDYRTAYFRDLDGGYYKLTLSVGKNADGKEIYNIGSIKKSTFPGRKLSVLELKGSGKGTTDSIAQKGDTVNSNIRKSNTNDTNVRNKIRDAEITSEDIKAVQSVGRKSVNDFSSEDIKATEGFAKKYYREMGTKSPFFRAWFGDWRAEDKSPVRIADRKGAARGVVRNADTGWDVQVSGKVFNETKSHNQNYNVKARPYLDYINSIVENAVLLDSSTIPSGKAKSENSAMMHSLYAIADMGSGRELIKLYVEELNDVNSDGTIKRAYQLQNIENQQSNDRVQEKSLAPSASTADVNTISQLYALVKASDKNFSSKSASKVVNEDGSPKVVYHGTGERFTVFDITKSRSYDEKLNYDLPGFYFSESADESGSYGGDVGAYYINISNPYQGDTYALAKERGSYRKAYDWLVSQGYDGVIIDELGKGYYEYIVFKPEQIKSATDNVGTFDKGNPDIRFKIRDVEDIPTGADTQHKFGEEWNGKIKEYGAIDKGENPARDIKVPRKISKTQYVSQFARTAMEAGITPNSVMGEFEKRILDGTMTHERITNKKAARFAKQEIEDGGFSNTLDAWLSDARRRKLTKRDMAVGMELYNQAITNKDIPNAMKLAAELAAEATLAGQSLQAVRMLKQMSPDGQLYYIERSIHRMNKEYRDKLGGKFRNIKPDPALMEGFLTAKDEQTRNAVYDKLCQNIADQIPSTGMDKWNAWRYLCMLGNLKTHTRNIVGNASFVPAVKISDYIGAMAEKLSGVSAGERTKSIRKSKAAVEFAKQDVQKMMKTLRGGDGKYATINDIDEKRTIFKNKVIETARKKNGAALEAEDAWFLKLHYVDALAQVITARGLDVNNIDAKTLDGIRDIAVQKAKAATYRDENSLAQAFIGSRRRALASESRALRGAGYLMEGVMPFANTPLNIAKQGLNYSPFGVFNAIYKGVRRLAAGEAYSATDVINDLSKGLTGTGIMALGFALSRLGFLVPGDDDDDKENAFNKLTGGQSYAIKIGDRSYSIDWLVPLSLPLFIGAQLDRLTQNKFSIAEVTRAMSTITEPMLDLSVLSSVNGAIEAARYNKTNAISAVAANAAESYLLQALPTLGGQLSRIIDDTRREYSYVDRNSKLPQEMQKLAGRIAAKVPFASYLFEPALDEWGRTKSYGGLGRRIAENTISPGYYSERKYTDVDKELERLYRKTGVGGVFPSKAPKKILYNGTNYFFDAKQYNEFKKMRGEKSLAGIQSVMRDEGYGDLSDSEKVKAIKEQYDIAAEKARVEAIAKFVPEKQYLADAPDGFSAEILSRNVTVGKERWRLEGEDLDKFEQVRLARYKRLAQCDNVKFDMQNPYGTPKRDWSAEQYVKYNKELTRMRSLLDELYKQGAVSGKQYSSILAAYQSGKKVPVRGVEYYAPTKVKREKKFAELTAAQKNDYANTVARDMKNGKMSAKEGYDILMKISAKEWDFSVEVSEYLTGDIDNLSREEKKKVYSTLNSLSTEFAKEYWNGRRSAR